MIKVFFGYALTVGSYVAVRLLLASADVLVPSYEASIALTALAISALLAGVFAGCVRSDAADAAKLKSLEDDVRKVRAATVESWK